MYKHASNACVIFFLAWLKYVANFALFCRKSELRCNFALFGVILMAFDLVSFYFYYIYCITLLTLHQFQGNKKFEAAGRVLFIA